MPFQKGHPVFKGAEKGWFKKGEPSLLKGIKLSKKHVTKLRKAKLKNPVRYWLGKKRSEETKKKISLRKSGVPLNLTKEERIKKAVRGSNHWQWKGGISPVHEVIRKSADYVEWRKKVFERDNYTCQVCNKRGVKLHAHHVKGFAKYPELRFDLANGLTLCELCHKLTDNYAAKANR